jgi:germination protein M
MAGSRRFVPIMVLLVIASAACSSVPGSASPTVTTPAPTATVAPTARPTPTPAPTATPVPTPAPSDTMLVRAYFFLDDAVDGDPAIVPVLRSVPATTAVAKAAILALLAGPNDKERAADPAIHSMIPEGVELLGIDLRGGTATIDLSGAFGSGGGTFTMHARLAQVTWTLTQFSTIERVAFALDGEPVSSFSSEGIVIDEPLTRASYRDTVLPRIYVDRPAWGAALLTPGRVTGLAAVYEGQFRIALLDRRGDVLVERPVEATCGSGCWGRFDVTLRYDVSAAQWGTLRVWDPSERDGSPEALRDYPMYLRPGGE